MENKKCPLNTHMMRFKKFMQQDELGEEKKDIKATLSKLPPSHAALVKGFKWKFHAGNTLNGDNDHVGYMDDGQDEIAVAAPWNYGREFTILHEIAHKVWEKLPPQLQQQWHQLVLKMNHIRKKNKALQQEPEEIFCMVYSNCYAKHKILTYYVPEWMDFIKNLPS